MSFIEYWVGYEVVSCTRESLGSAVRQDCLSVLTFAMWSVVASEDMMLFMARNQGHYGS